MYEIIISIDPGAEGGYAVQDADCNVLDVGKYGPLAPTELLNVYRDLPRAVAVIERVHASPIMGPSAAFSFGRNYGEWLGAIRAHGFAGRTWCVDPQEWQREHRADLGETKGDARKAALAALARRLYVGPRVTLANCDALLLGRYAVNLFNAGSQPGKLL